jgi:hypothetical protein
MVMVEVEGERDGGGGVVERVVEGERDRVGGVFEDSGEKGF